jgi:hypothetical protein
MIRAHVSSVQTIFLTTGRCITPRALFPGLLSDAAPGLNNADDWKVVAEAKMNFTGWNFLHMDSPDLKPDAGYRANYECTSKACGDGTFVELLLSSVGSIYIGTVTSNWDKLVGSLGARETSVFFDLGVDPQGVWQGHHEPIWDMVRLGGPQQAASNFPANDKCVHHRR